MKMSVDEENEVERFKYLRSALQKAGGFEDDTNHRIKCERMCREQSGILYDKRIQIRLNGKFCKTVVRPPMMIRMLGRR